MDKHVIERLGLDRKTVRVTVKPDFYFSSNDKTTGDKLKKWIDECEAKAKQTGVENGSFSATYSEDEFGHVHSQYLTYSGYRNETAKEFKDRIELDIQRARVAKENNERLNLYYQRQDKDGFTSYDVDLAARRQALEKLKGDTLDAGI